MKETIPAAIPVEDIAAQIEIAPDKLSMAIVLAAAPGCTVDLGDGLKVRVEIVDEANLSDDALIKMVHLRLTAQMRRWIVPAAPPTSKRIQ
jgi:hypothetical protein